MAPRVEFCLLGPLVVRCDGVVVPIQRGKQRAMLAVLLLKIGYVVSVDELAVTLWGPAPPPSALVTVQNYVKRLRHTLAEAGSTRISTQPPGYKIDVDPGQLDISRFEALLEAAQAAARNGSWDTAAARARSSLALWRGEPLADVESESLALLEVPRLAEMRLQALETRLEADLRLGRAPEAIAELRRLAGDHPLREHLHRLLMLALYRDGRQGEALAAYHDARSVLVEELGAEPGSQLRDLHMQILAGVPVLEAGDSARPGSAVAALAVREPAVPRQSPGPVPHFTGRTDELAALTGLLGRSGAQATGTVAIGGTAGVGKTALALHWAHQVSGRFPDGQLYVNLRGYDESEPMPAAAALAGFLRALGMAGPDIPADTDERSAAYRSLLSGRKMLVVLDNASRVDQVRPLLPGSLSCVTLVTSRDSLAGLVARDGATRLELDLLPMAEAVALLRVLIGERAVADPDAAARLAACCCRLPLALRVSAELAAARPDAPLAVLAAELADAQRRLDPLDAGGDGQTGVREVFSWSCRHLEPQTARAFSLAARHPGIDFDVYALAALTGSSHQQASGMARQLARAHLIQPAGALRYGMHDLLRAFGQELAEGEIDTRPALISLLDYFQYAAARAMDLLFPAETDQRPSIQEPHSPVPPVTDQQAARAWLDSERVNLVAAVSYATDQGWSAHALGLARILSRYLIVGGYFSEATTVQGSAVRAAALTGDRGAEAWALSNLANIHQRQSRYQQATTYYERAQVLCRQAADRLAEFRVLSGLAMINQVQGRYSQAADNFQQILDLGRSTGSQFQQIRGLLGLGTIALLCGRYPQADSQLRQAVQICDQIGDGVLMAGALISLGDLNLRQGHYQQARNYFERSRVVCRDTGDQLAELHAVCFLALTDLRQGHYSQAADQLREVVSRSRASGYRNGEAQACCYLGELNLRRERHQQAQEDLQHALVICTDTGDLPGQTEVFNLTGELFLATGKPAEARTHYGTALSLAGQLNDPYQQARAHHGLGNVHTATGHDVQARYHWNEALTRFAMLETTEADTVRAHLAVNLTLLAPLRRRVRSGGGEQGQSLPRRRAGARATRDSIQL